MATTPSSPEKGLTLSKSVEANTLIVSQPGKLKELNDLLLTFESYSDKIGETTGEDRSGDMGAASRGGQAGSGQGVSPRDQAIANVPAEAVMQQELRKHIEKEIKQLSKVARRVSRARSPGSAHKLNEIYARIRRLNALIVEILHASYEVVKKFFVRVFIDEQPVL